MSIKKQTLKNKPICKVTFKLEGETIPQAKSVYLVGAFNMWNPKKNPMQKFKDGSFRTAVELNSGLSYQFRYLVDDKTWINEHKADGYLPNPFGDDNCIVVL